MTIAVQYTSETRLYSPVEAQTFFSFNGTAILQHRVRLCREGHDGAAEVLKQGSKKAAAGDGVVGPGLQDDVPLARKATGRQGVHLRFHASSALPLCTFIHHTSKQELGNARMVL